MLHVPDIFDRHAPGYDAERRRLIPPFDAFYGAAVEALGLAGRPLRRVLDLGAGTGLLARAILHAHPDARLTLLDGSQAMLAQAHAALGDRVAYLDGDLAGELAPGPWDAIVSALAIHHLDDDVKRALFARVHAALEPGGVFVDADQVSAPTSALGALYAAWHERSAFALGASAQEWAGARERMRADRLAPLSDQLGWLRDAGFADVDCIFKDHCFAVLVARRPPCR